MKFYFGRSTYFNVTSTISAPSSTLYFLYFYFLVVFCSGSYFITLFVEILILKQIEYYESSIKLKTLKKTKRNPNFKLSLSTSLSSILFFQIFSLTYFIIREDEGRWANVLSLLECPYYKWRMTQNKFALFQWTFIIIKSTRENDAIFIVYSRERQLNPRQHRVARLVRALKRPEIKEWRPVHEPWVRRNQTLRYTKKIPDDEKISPQAKNQQVLNPSHP